MNDLLGEVLGDRYQIQSLLGRQTGRRTFLAQDLEGDSPVVLKLLLFGPDFSWDDLKLFEREAEVLKSLNHPAIPKYLDHFDVETELGKGYVLVQSYIPAKSLQDWVKSGRTFSEEDLKAIAKEMLDILGYLHGRQPPVIHRDIKPSNILLGDRSGHSIGPVYLVDFGSVQTVVNAAGTRTVVGTYGYMPPEQFGGKISAASDLFALGATLVYLATGEHPDQLPQKDFLIQFEDRVNLSNGFITWIRKLIEPNLDLRFKSTVEAIELLRSSIAQNDSSLQLKSLRGSKVKVYQSLDAIDILIPSRGFRLDSILQLLGLFVFEATSGAMMGVFGGLTMVRTDLGGQRTVV
jgi:serine/threonine protein kinase